MKVQSLRENPIPYQLVYGQNNHELATYIDKFTGKKAGRVLNYGSSCGPLSLRLGEKGYQVEGVENNYPFLQFARKQYSHGKVSYYQANFSKPTTLSPSYSCIIIPLEELLLIEREEELDQVLLLYAKMIELGGYLILRNSKKLESGEWTLESEECSGLFKRSFSSGPRGEVYCVEDVLLKQGDMSIPFQQKEKVCLLDKESLVKKLRLINLHQDTSETADFYAFKKIHHL